ncbi:MAG: MerC domain-containing protein [Pacificimonas sp.]|jgi:hypothetical protein|nr:MerC domain-containing protein [Pacificimonas sp.]
MPLRANLLLDRIAIGLSGLCLVHCLGGVLLVTMASASGLALYGHDVHQWGLALAIPVAAVGLVGGALSHGRWQVIAVGGAGLAVMAAALTVGHGTEEVILTVIGVTMVAAAHVMNMRWAHNCT